MVSFRQLMNDFRAETGLCGMPWKNGLKWWWDMGRVVKAKRVTWAARMEEGQIVHVQRKTDIW